MTGNTIDKDDKKSLDSIDPKVTKEAVRFLESIDSIEWKGGEETDEKWKDGSPIISWPHPDYPHELFRFLSIAGVDTNYGENYKNNCEGVPIEEMGLPQIRTMLTRIVRGERFCDGYIINEIENGNLLRLFKRLDQLVNADTRVIEGAITSCGEE